MNISLNRLLHFDGMAALTAGLSLLLFRNLGPAWLGLPVWLLTAQALVNLLYAAYSMPLARRSQRPVWMIRVLAIANMVYAFGVVPCLAWYCYPGFNLLGLLYFLLEIVFIGGLGLLEWNKLKAINE